MAMQIAIWIVSVKCIVLLHSIVSNRAMQNPYLAPSSFTPAIIIPVDTRLARRHRSPSSVQALRRWQAPEAHQREAVVYGESVEVVGREIFRLHLVVGTCSSPLSNSYQTITL
jgi:hypothetical protein